MVINEQQALTAENWQQILAELSTPQIFNETSANLLLERIRNIKELEFKPYLNLKSVALDLTSTISKFTQSNKLLN